MIRTIKGRLMSVKDSFAVVETGGIGYLINMSKRSLAFLPDLEEEVSLYTHLHVKEDLMELYGFQKEEELNFFELLIGISGVGPRSALAVLDVDELNNLKATIVGNRPDLMTRAPGIGKKTAERIILELRNKVTSKDEKETVKRMEGDVDLMEALLSLGYRPEEARTAIDAIDSDLASLEERFKVAMRILKGK